MNTENIPKRS